MKWYYEIAISEPRKRGSLISTEDIKEIILQYGKETDLYRSTYLYPEDAVEQIVKEGSTKHYIGQRWIQYVPIDIDRGNDTDEACRIRTIEIVNKLEYMYGLNDANYCIYYSGTGYHVDVSASVFGFEPHADLPAIVSSTMMSMFPHIDKAIYMRTGLYRMNYSKNSKSGRYKIPLERYQLEELSAQGIMKLAEEYPNIEDFTEHDDFMGEMIGKQQLRNLIVTSLPDQMQYLKVAEPITIAPCIQAIYNRGPSKGSRNVSSMRIISHFKRNGIPFKAAVAAMLAWNEQAGSDALPASSIVQHAENGYNRNYKYGCNDSILKKECNTRCIYFKNKDYNVELYDTNAMFAELEKSIEKRKSGKYLDIAAMLGQPDVDCAVFPGELVTVFGPTGSGKTAFVQHLILGMNMATGRIDPSLQLNTIYLSLELGVALMAQRFSQIAGGYTKSFVRAYPKEVRNKVEGLIGNVQIRLVSGNIKEIQEIVRQLNPEVLVVDYLDLVESNERGEYEKLKEIAHGLSAIAVNNDIIIIEVAQVRRENAREHQLDLYAGKGSGAIENASRKVIGLNGQSNDPHKHVQVFKNTDGELLEADLYHDGSTLRFSVLNKPEIEPSTFGRL